MLPAPGGARDSRAARAAVGERPTMSTTSIARPTESTSIASRSGSMPSAPLPIGSGPCASSGASRRDSRERSMSRHTRATTVVSQPPRFSTPLALFLEPLRQPGLFVHRSHALDAHRHSTDDQDPADVTRRRVTSAQPPRRNNIPTNAERRGKACNGGTRRAGPSGRCAAKTSGSRRGISSHCSRSSARRRWCPLATYLL